MFVRFILLSNFIIILSIIGFLLPGFSSAQQNIEQPETLEEAKELGEEALKTTQKELPGILKTIWEEEVLPIWQKIGDWFKNVWDSYLFPFIENIWQKIQSFLGQEIEKRKPIIEEEFKKEGEEMKEEIKEEAPKVGRSLWEKFKELIK